MLLGGIVTSGNRRNTVVQASVKGLIDVVFSTGPEVGMELHKVKVPSLPER